MGCSAIPLASPKEDEIAKQFHPSPDHAVVYVFRDQAFVGSAVAASLFVDGKLTGGVTGQLKTGHLRALQNRPL
jgi:hypothetical protein